ncbi:MAG: hypothetical protein V3S32_07990 [Acidimicrobiia bacterium]
MKTNDDQPAVLNRSKDHDEKTAGVRWPELRTDLSPVLLGVLLVTSAILLLASSLGLLSWLVTIVAIPALGATLVEGGRWVTIAGGVAVIVIVLGSAIGGADNPATEQNANVESTSLAPPPAVPGSLGINISDMTDLWNSLAEPPKITRGLVHNTEPGEYDSFIYRFGDWGRLAGAYDPSTDAVYALVATGQFSNEATSQLYLHLCFMLNPYSQECIDNYFEKGLAYGSLADFSGVTHQAEWQMDDQTWRLEIGGNVLTIRVLAEVVS